ncbi:MAG: hypothetical protein GX421_02285 [Caldisericales bacterium]|nr:hypothetical protein [Caldisericales bacterium]
MKHIVPLNLIGFSGGVSPNMCGALDDPCKMDGCPVLFSTMGSGDCFACKCSDTSQWSCDIDTCNAAGMDWCSGTSVDKPCYSMDYCESIDISDCFQKDQCKQFDAGDCPGGCTNKEACHVKIGITEYAD